MTAPRRVQRTRRLAEPGMPEGAKYVGRGARCRYGNPYTVDMYRVDFPDADEHELRRMAVSDFAGMLAGRWEHPDGAAYPSVAEIRRELAGRDLACWCPETYPCHGDVLVSVANCPEGQVGAVLANTIGMLAEG